MTEPRFQLEIVSDTICPWCYVGRANLQAALPVLAAEGIHFDIVWKPFQLNPAMPPDGVDRRQYRTQKFGSWQRSQALDAGVAEAGAAAGIAFRHELMQRTPNTIPSHILIHLAYQSGGASLQDRIVEALFTAYFTAGQDIGDPAVLAALAASQAAALAASQAAALGTDQGLDHATVLAALADPARAEAVRAEERLARTLSLDGVPSFVIDGHFLFSGAQPPAAMVSAFRQAARVLRERRSAA